MKVDAGVTSTPPPPPPGPSAQCRNTEYVIANIFRPACGLCHDRNLPTYSMRVDLVAQGVRDRLRLPSDQCRTRTFVTTQPAVGGLLFEKLVGDVVGCGTRMPPFGTALTPDQISCLKAWVTANP